MCHNPWFIEEKNNYQSHHSFSSMKAQHHPQFLDYVHELFSYD